MIHIIATMYSNARKDTDSWKQGCHRHFHRWAATPEELLLASLLAPVLNIQWYK